MKINKLEEENKILKMEIENMKKRHTSNKEYFLKKIGEVFGESAITVEEYVYKGEERSYEKLKDFYDAMGRMGKDNLIDLLNKLHRLRDEVKGE